MKLRFSIFLITLLLPTTAFANSCASFLKNKNYERQQAYNVFSVAIGTYKPTKETKWIECEGPSQIKYQTIDWDCEGRIFRFFPMSPKSVMIKDKLGKFFPLIFKGKWKKRFCIQQANSYLDTDREFYKFHLKEAGGKFLLRVENNQRYETYRPIF